MHWQRWRKGNVPLDAPFRNKRGWLHHRGYRWISVDGKDVQEHRWLMEQHLGRKLRSDEAIHHKNHDKADNRLENLEVVDHAAHTSHHRTKRRPCRVCGRDDKHQAQGLCGKHYQRARRNGSIKTLRP
jgi:hypothetical protein